MENIARTIKMYVSWGTIFLIIYLKFWNYHIVSPVVWKQSSIH